MKNFAVGDRVALYIESPYPSTKFMRVFGTVAYIDGYNHVVELHDCNHLASKVCVVMADILEKI